MGLATPRRAATSPLGPGQPLDVEHQVRQLVRRADGPLLALGNDRPGDVLAVRLVGQVSQGQAQSLLVDRRQQVGRGLLHPRVHAHVERAVVLVAEASRRVVDLHARHTEIGQDGVVTVEPFSPQGGVDAREVAPMEIQCGPGKRGPQPVGGPLELLAVDVEGHEPSAGQDAPEDGLGVGSISERGVGDRLARLQLQRHQDLVDHDRHMRSGRRAALGPNMLANALVSLGRPFLVLLVEARGMGAAVALAARRTRPARRESTESPGPSLTVNLRRLSPVARPGAPTPPR